MGTESAPTRPQSHMERKYDLFEILPDGSPMWLAAVTGRENALIELRALAADTENEVRMMDILSNSIIAAINVPKIAGEST